MRILGIWLMILASILIAIPVASTAQDVEAPRPQRGTITGTASDDVNSDPIPGANVTLQGGALKEPRTLVSDENGFFEFNDVDVGTYSVVISAAGFAKWTSPPVIIAPGQYVILTESKLHVAEAMSTVTVTYDAEEVATEEVKIAEQQRILGIIPNFYVVYHQNAAPLTAKLKYKLALRVSRDPITMIGVAMRAAMNQAGDTPNYVQGWKGYGYRVGAVAGDGFSDIMIGGAILPSLLHQDPRYFFQGTGTKKSRALHALSSPFICKGDNGERQANYSSLGGDLASASLSNLYYPESNRGAALVFDNFAISTGERMLSSMVQEFVLHKLTSRGKKKN